MVKLDSQKRLYIGAQISKIAGFIVPCRVYCIYDNGALLLKQQPNFGVDKVLAQLSIDEKYRLFVGRLFSQIGFEKDAEFLIWVEPEIVHIEKN